MSTRNFSQNAGNGHFRDSNFQKFLGEHAPDAKGMSSAVPPLLKVLDPSLPPHLSNLCMNDRQYLTTSEAQTDPRYHTNRLHVLYLLDGCKRS